MGITAVAVVPIGLAARYLGSGLVADISGGVLYAALFYALFAFAFPKASPAKIAAAALAWCWLIELAQLTSVPRLLSDWFAPLHLIFGSGFAPIDLAAYALGVAVAWLIDTRCSPKPTTD